MPEAISQTTAPGAKSTRCDVLVIRGGPGGSTAARRLRAANIRSDAEHVTSE